jgi:hypothetical protein
MDRQHSPTSGPRRSNSQQPLMDVRGRAELRFPRTSKPVVGAFATKISVGYFQIGGTFGGTGRRLWPSGRRQGPISYSESGADERIRTADPLFTNQTAIEFSW